MAKEGDPTTCGYSTPGGLCRIRLSFDAFDPRFAREAFGGKTPGTPDGKPPKVCPTPALGGYCFGHKD